MRTAIYLRVSTREQSEEGFSIRAQKQRLEAYVSSQDWVIYDYYIDEGKSAKDTNRPELQRMMDDVEYFDVILVYKLDRLTRSVLDLYKLLEHFDKHDTKFKSATEIYDTTTATGRLFLTLVAALAQWERENLSERVSMGMARMVEEGKWHGGKLPIGYKYENKQIVINEEESPAVRVIYEMYANGNGGKKICGYLNSHGYKMRKAKHWDVSQVHSILSNPAYIGDFRYKDQIMKGFAPPIVSESLFHRVQQIKKSRQNKHPREITSNYIFTGMIICHRCGSKMHGKKKESRGNVYMMYSCAGRINGICDIPYINELHIEEQLLSAIEKVQKEYVGIETEIETNDTTKEKERLNKELDAIKKRRKKWQEAFVNEAITVEELREHNAQDEERMHQIQKKLNELEETVHYDMEELSNITENWNVLTVSEKKILVQSLIERLVIDCENGVMGRGKKRKVWIEDILWVE